jgi:hypothetical protein
MIMKLVRPDRTPTHRVRFPMVALTATVTLSLRARREIGR